jgi:UDP-2,3-diacylglucosamine pyrophosphatase LpxH
MLVIISDLHLTDGTSGETINESAFRVFANRLRDLAYDASWRANGSYKPIERLDLILLGDILDVLRSTRWLAEAEGASGFTRPWDADPHRPAFVNKIDTITEAILQNNAASLGILQSLTNGKTITLPPATRAGRPAQVSWQPEARGRVPVEVRLHYMVGNHDWFYHLPGPAHQRIRQKIVAGLGLSHPATEPFPHDLSESAALQSICETHQVFTRHGDIFDPYTYEKEAGRDASSLGDALVVELLNRFPRAVRLTMEHELPPVCLDGLNELDNVRPMLVMPVWLNSLLRRTCNDPQQIAKVKDIWDGLVDHFLSIPFVQQHDTLSLFDDVDHLRVALKFSKGVSLRTASRLMSWVGKEIDSDTLTFYRTALAEPALKNRTARFIVHGHTHHYEIVPLDTTLIQGEPFNQMYLNAGTWRRVHELAKINPEEEEFMGYHVMAYFAFFKDDERGGRPFEAWSGALGV